VDVLLVACPQALTAGLTAFLLGDLIKVLLAET